MATLRLVGKFLISVGVGVLLFVAWTLWGTGLYTARQQRALAAEYERLPAVSTVPLVPSADPREEKRLAPPPGATTDVPADFLPEPGAPVFRLIIPTLDVDYVVVEGVGIEELRLGPGHYPSCRSGFRDPLCTDFPATWPGESGRVIVSGHRTTYGAPFYDLDRLEPGDEIIIEAKWGSGRFVYEVTDDRIVSPHSSEVVTPGVEPELVLTTCNPKFSAAERLVVFSRLVRT